MSYRTSISASFFDRYLSRVSYRQLGRNFNKLMKSGRLHKVVKLVS